MPSGVYNHELTHKSNCPCCMCKNKRGETKGIPRGKNKNPHKLDCQCCSCKSRRGEKHKSNCSCCICKTTRGETKGVNHSQYGKHPTEETIQKLIKSHTGTHPTEETIQKMIKTRIKNWQNPLYKEKQLRAIFKGLEFKPTKPEQLLNKLLQELFPNQYRYVGDGSVLIGYKNPDFINVAEHKIIELFGDYWHSEEVTGISIEQHVRERIEHFEKHGYPILIVWEHELKDIDKLKRKIISFTLD